MFKNEKTWLLPNEQLKTTKFRVKTQRSYCKLQQKPYNHCSYKCTRIALASIPPFAPWTMLVHYSTILFTWVEIFLCS